jgi:hypothetical protein
MSWTGCDPMASSNFTRSIFAITLLFIHCTTPAQTAENDEIKISIIEQKNNGIRDTCAITITHTYGNWFKIHAVVKQRHLHRRIHRNRIIKFKRKFDNIPGTWRDCDFCPMSFVTFENRNEQLSKQSPSSFSQPEKLKRILKIWK